jgi:hypothetical protein
MKKTMLAMFLGVALLAPAITSGQSQKGCEASNNKPKGCEKKNTPMPEPGSVLLLTSGLLGLAGYTMLRRKNVTQ